MNWYKHLKISTKLIIGFLTIALISLIVGVVGIGNIQSMNIADTKLYKENTLGIKYSSNAAIYYQRLRYNVIEMILLKDASMQNDFTGKVDTFIATIDDALKSYEDGIESEEDRGMFDTLKLQWENYRAYILETMQLAQAGKYEQAQRVILGDADAVGGSVQDALNQLEEYNDVTAKTRSESNTKLAFTSSIMMIIIILIGVAISLFSGMFIANLIGNPINKMAEAAEKLAVGDVNINLEADTKDEIGKLAKAFGVLIASTRAQALDAEKVAAGDLTVEVAIRSENDLLGKKLSELVHSMNELITNIVKASEQVASGSQQVSNSSMTLSQGAAEQASSVEELTASLEEISAQTKLNANNANLANQLTATAMEDAVQGNDQMKEMLTAMDEINVSSGNIYKIIKVIDDIAFQTNILALNAAIEAARAGEQGKGFAVVAEEVRNLAARSANAAKETTDMIENSIKKVEDGTKLAKDTAEALNKIVTETEKAANLVNDISVASNQQALGIEQVNQGIIQVSQVVQSNSATSEESAAASEELSSQAVLLRELVSKFKLTKSNKSYNKSNFTGTIEETYTEETVLKEKKMTSTEKY